MYVLTWRREGEDRYDIKGKCESNMHQVSQSAVWCECEGQDGNEVMG